MTREPWQRGQLRSARPRAWRHSSCVRTRGPRSAARGGARAVTVQVVCQYRQHPVQQPQLMSPTRSDAAWSQRSLSSGMREAEAAFLRAYRSCLIGEPHHTTPGIQQRLPRGVLALLLLCRQYSWLVAVGLTSERGCYRRRRERATPSGPRSLELSDRADTTGSQICASALLVLGVVRITCARYDVSPSRR